MLYSDVITIILNHIVRVKVEISLSDMYVYAARWCIIKVYVLRRGIQLSFLSKEDLSRCSTACK